MPRMTTLLGSGCHSRKPNSFRSHVHWLLSSIPLFSVPVFTVLHSEFCVKDPMSAFIIVAPNASRVRCLCSLRTFNIHASLSRSNIMTSFHKFLGRPCTPPSHGSYETYFKYSSNHCSACRNAVSFAYRCCWFFISPRTAKPWSTPLYRLI